MKYQVVSGENPSRSRSRRMEMELSSPVFELLLREWSDCKACDDCAGEVAAELETLAQQIVGLQGELDAQTGRRGRVSN